MSGISDKAMIAKLNIYGLGFTETDRRTTKRVHNELLTESRDAGHWQKLKIDRQDLVELTSVVNEARLYYRSMTRPFGDDGARLLPATLTFEYQKKMGEFERRYNDAKKKIIEDWDAIIERQRVRLGPEFNPTSYPTKDRLDRSFRFEPRLSPVPDWAQIHDKDHVIFKIEKAVAEDIVEKAREDERRLLAESTIALWLRLMKIVERIKASCLEKHGIYRTVFETLDEEVRLIKALNFMEDDELNGILDSITTKIRGWTVKQIKRDPELKKRIGLAAEAIADQIRARVETGVLIKQAA